jgi:hypothetical protein
VSLDEEPRVVLNITTGNQAIKDAQILITSLQNEVGYALDRATAQGHGEMNCGGCVLNIRTHGYG